MEQHIVWSHLYQPGMEHLRLTQLAEEVFADGLVIAIVDDVPVRVHYALRCDASWRVRELRVALLDTGVRSDPISMLHVQADGEGHWKMASGASLSDLDGCIDVDISVTPFTNTLPIRRLSLPPGASQEIVVAYVGIPEITLQPFKQRYTCLERQAQGSSYRYDSVVSGFTADLTVDRNSLVITYPGLFQRAWASMERPA